MILVTIAAPIFGATAEWDCADATSVPLPDFLAGYCAANMADDAISHMLSEIIDGRDYVLPDGRLAAILDATQPDD